MDARPLSNNSAESHKRRAIFCPHCFSDPITSEMNTRRTSRSNDNNINRPPRLVVAKSVDLSNEEDRFWGVYQPKLEYVALVNSHGIDYLVDYRKKGYERKPRMKTE